MTRHSKGNQYMYGELNELDAKLLELPYMDSKVSMYILLPNTVDGKNFSYSPSANEVWGKVMFLLMSVILSTREGVPV